MSNVNVRESSEIWRDVKGYEGFYQVSNLGRVRSLDRDINCGDGIVRHFRGKMLNPMMSAQGYPMVNLRRNASYNYRTIHFLVAQAFLGERPEGYHIDHIDRNRTNSKLSNLRYIPHAENEAQGAERQRKAVMQIKDGKVIKTFVSISEASRQTGISRGDICRTCKGTRNHAHGYVWRYAE